MTNKQTSERRYSIIVILDEENDGFAEYVCSLDKIFFDVGVLYEIIIIANGKEGILRKELPRINIRGKLKAFSLNKKTSQAVCLNTGLSESAGDIIVACGSYQQLTEKAMKSLIDNFDEELDIISPWRQKRVDSKFSQLQSKIFNKLTQLVADTDLHDLSCTVKIFRRVVVEEIKLYGNMYRFLPVLASKKGFQTKEVLCEHYQERGKEGLYNLSEYFERLVDVLTLFFHTRFVRKPLRFFSILGAFSTAIGSAALLYIGGQKIFLGYPIGGRPVLLMALLCVIFGIQITSAGLLGEIIAFTHSRLKKEYNIDEII